MSSGIGAACGAVLWAAGLLSLGVGSVLLAVLPRDREGVNAGLAAGIALGAVVAMVRYVSAACG